MTAGIGTNQFLYQTYYPQSELPFAIPDNLPISNMLNKQGGLSGDVIDVAFIYGARQGYSQDYNSAKTQRGTQNTGARAALRCSQAYTLFEVLEKDRALSGGDASYGDLWQKTMEGTMLDFHNQLDLDFHAAGTGWRGTVSAIAGGVDAQGGVVGLNQICLAVGLPLDAVFSPGQSVQATTYTGFPLAGSIFPPSDGRQATTISVPVQVVAVDSVRRLVTLTDASAFTTTSFVAQAGCALGFSSTNLLGGIVGIEAWNPYGGVPSTDNLCGLNRYQFQTRMCGTWVNGSNSSIEDAIKKCSSKMSTTGAKNSTIVGMSPLDWDALDSKLMTQYKYSTLDLGVYGFSSLVINGASGGRMDCVVDPHQPQGYARIYDMSAFTVHHAGDIPHMATYGGSGEYPSDNFDGTQTCLRAYLQMKTNQPWKLGTVKLPTIIS